MRDLTPTRSAYLDLQEERIGMQEGYRFLDEKRLVLAAETLQELERYESIMQEFKQQYATACVSLQGAVERHGISGLQNYPAMAYAWGDLHRQSRSVLGLQVNQVELESNPESSIQAALFASPEADEARQKFTGLISLAAELAASSANLVRLQDDYQRTSRRARALEDVLLPEIDQAMAQIDASLDEMDKEEIVRVRYGIKT